MDDIQIKIAMQAEAKVGDYLDLRLNGGGQHTGRLVELKDSYLILENIEAFWDKRPDGTRQPNIGYNKPVIAYEDITYFIVVG